MTRRRWPHAHEFALRALQLCAVVLPLAVGGVFPAFWGAALVVLCLAGVVLARTARHHGYRLGLGLAGMALAGLAGWSLLQCVPWPAPVVRALAPAVWRWHLDAAQVLGRPAPSWAPLTDDEIDTLLTAGKFTLLAVAFALALNATWRRAEHGEALLRTVAFAAIVVLGLGAVQKALGTGVLLGYYEPHRPIVDTLLVASFVNPNHLAALLNLGGLTALGLSQASSRYRQRLAWGIAYLACMCGTFLTLSRAGIVAAVVASAFFALVSLRAERQAALRRRRVVVYASGILVVLTLVSVMAYDLVAWQLSHLPGIGRLPHEAKDVIWARVVQVIADHPWTGVGAGALADAFGPYNDVRPGVLVTHAENAPLDLAVQWGIPAALLFVAALLAATRRHVPRALRAEDTLGGLAGLYALGIQNLADFNWFIPGVAVPACIVAGAVTGLGLAARKGRRRKAVPVSRASRVVISLLLAAMAVAILGAWADARWGDSAVEDAYRRADESGTLAVPSALDRFAALHPADYHLFFLEGRRRYEARDLDGAVRWVEASLRRAPTAPLPRVLRARLAMAQGDEDTAVEQWRAIVQADDEHGVDLLIQEWGAQHTPFDLWIRALQTESRVVRAALLLKARGDDDGSQSLLARWVRAHPEAYSARFELALALLERGAPSDEVDRQATHLLGRHPERAGGYLIQGMLYARDERWERALVMFDEALRREPDNPHAVLGRARALLELGRIDEFRRAVGHARALVENAPRLRARVHVLLSMAAERDQRAGEAAMEMEMAAELLPDSAPLRYRLGKMLELAGRAAGARRAYREALRIDPNYAPARKALERLESKQPAEH